MAMELQAQNIEQSSRAENRSPNPRFSHLEFHAPVLSPPIQTQSRHAVPRISATKAAFLLAFINMITASLTGVTLDPLIAGTEGALKWQPVLDWDKDVCYQTSAIDSNGNTNPGLDPKFCVG